MKERRERSSSIRAGVRVELSLRPFLVWIVPCGEKKQKKSEIPEKIGNRNPKQYVVEKKLFQIISRRILSK